MDVVMHLNMSVSDSINSTEMLRAIERALCSYCISTGQVITLHRAHVMTEQVTTLDKIISLKEEL